MLFGFYLENMEEPHFEYVRRSRTHSKCDFLLNFRLVCILER